MTKWLLILAPIFMGGLTHALVTEDEPNNTSQTANLIACGDTVYCADLATTGDLDHFRFHAWMQDSIIATTVPCDGSVTNTVLALCDDRDSLLTVNQNDGPGLFSEIRYVAPRSADYVLRVLRHPAYPDCTYSLILRCPIHLPESYDYCTTPRVIPSLPYYDEGCTAGMTSQCGTGAPDVFYRFHHPATGNLYVTVCSDFFDARVQILGQCCNEFMDDADTGCNLGAELTVWFLPAGDYYILVEGTSANQVGYFSLDVSAQLPGCPAPGPVVLGSVGGYPLLDWPEVTGPSYFVVWYSPTANGIYDHLGTTPFTYFVDSSGTAAHTRFYKVTSVCPW
ncbi:MAG TPA: hypothetical protein VGL38_09055 [bacterium]|jgi:hypothetical protein